MTSPYALDRPLSKASRLSAEVLWRYCWHPDSPGRFHVRLGSLCDRSRSSANSIDLLCTSWKAISCNVHESTSNRKHVSRKLSAVGAELWKCDSRTIWRFWDKRWRHGKDSSNHSCFWKSGSRIHFAGIEYETRWREYNSGKTGYAKNVSLIIVLQGFLTKSRNRFIITQRARQWIHSHPEPSNVTENQVQHSSQKTTRSQAPKSISFSQRQADVVDVIAEPEKAESSQQTRSWLERVSHRYQSLSSNERSSKDGVSDETNYMGHCKYLKTNQP